MLDDATGSGFTFEQLEQQIIGETLVAGRYGLLVDYDIDSAARIKPYTAENIINWRCKTYDDGYKLSLVVLAECADDLSEDGFEWKEQIQYRVLRLVDSVYIQEVYDHDGNLTSSIVPTDYNNNYFNQIPFAFVGSENNDAYVDSIPLYDLAVVNLGHYRNSADYEESIFITGQPFLVVNVGEASPEEFKAATPGGLLFGSRAGLVISNGGSANILQANPNQLADAAMKRKEEQAAAIGARLIAPPGGRETAEGARIRFGSQNSALYTLTKNVSLALEQCLLWASMFMQEAPEESEIQLNDQFYEDSADPNLIAQQIMLFDKKLMNAEEIRTNLDSVGIKLSDSYDYVPTPQADVNNNNPEGNNDGNIE